jgi:hypothetical protein
MESHEAPSSIFLRIGQNDSMGLELQPSTANVLSILALEPDELADQLILLSFVNG